MGGEQKAGTESDAEPDRRETQPSEGREQPATVPKPTTRREVGEEQSETDD
jgi:hypothetical protein